MYKKIDSSIEVNNATLWSMVNGLGSFKHIILNIFSQVGIKIGNERDPDSWTELNKWMDAFDKIKEELGTKTFYNIGLELPNSAVFPFKITNIEDAYLRLNDIYHYNHRKNGEPLYDIINKKNKNGIGNYKVKIIEPNKILRIISDTPYPCEFEIGLLTALGTMFDKIVAVSHCDGNNCRDKGSSNCEYNICWSE